MRIGIFVGSRPNFVKAACLIGKLDSVKEVEVVFVNTGQHYDYKMAGIFFEELGIRRPDINLEAAGSNHIETIANIIHKVKNNQQINSLDLAIVFGDVNSTLAATLGCVKIGIPVHHVESGLRSFDRRMPEEINRTIVDQMSTILYTSEEKAEINLVHEQISENNIYFVGNIMIDTLKKFLPAIKKSNIISEMGLEEKKYILFTMHRQENVDSKEGLEKVLKIINIISKNHTVVYPMHPRTKSMLKKHNLECQLEGVIILEPLGYINFLQLQRSAHSVFTDSGGIQEETSYLNVPCITLRDNTERPITITHGTNTLLPLDSKDIENEINRALKNPKYRTEEISKWDGNTSERITNIVLEKMKITEIDPK